MIRANENQTSYVDDMDSAPNAKWLLAFKAALRGRLLVATGLGLVLGGVAAGVLFVKIPPKYQSTGLVRVRSTTPTILKETGDQMGRYDQYLGSQVELIRSPRVTDMAMQLPVWAEMQRGFTPADQYKFRGSMGVSSRPSTEVIQVTFSDEEQKAAKAGAAAIIEAYLDIFNEQERGGERQRFSVLEDRENNLRGQLDSIRDEINGLVQSQGREGIRQQYASQLEMRNTLEISIQRDVDSLKVIQAAKESDNGLTPDQVTPEQAAQVSEKIAALMIQQRGLQGELRAMRIAGRGGEDRLVQTASKNLADIDLRIKEAINALKPEDLASLSIQVAVSESELAARIESQRSMSVDVGSRIEDLGLRIARLNELEKEESIIEGRLAETRSRIDTLNLETSAFQRVELLALDVSQQPVNGKKKLTMCGVAGIGGLAMGFGIIGGMGMMGGRVRGSQDALLGLDGRELLGLIPAVDSESDPESVEQAEQAIDHIRSMLQVGAVREETLSVAVTGPISGSGKTSVSLLLGRSFADAGYKTLLIDFDFVGQGLTAQFRRSLAPRIGDLLESVFGVNRKEIENAANDGDMSQPLGQKLSAMGLISESQLDKALSLQSGGTEPLRRVLDGEDIDSCVVKTRVKDLYALPLGQDDGGRVGQKAIDKLLGAANGAFEVIVMDTGPTPGAVEGALAAASVSRVLVVVARGDERSDIETCDHFLRSVRAPVAGYVLNRADQFDLKTSHLSLSLSRRSQPGRAGGAIDELLSAKD